MTPTQITEEVSRLLSDCRRTNELYWLLTLRGCGQHDRLVQYHVEINRLMSEVVGLRAKQVPVMPVPAHEALFVFQSVWESIAFYTVLRNYLNILVGRRWHPFPWIKGEYKALPGRIAFNKKQILSGLVTDLSSVGYTTLSKELERTHLGLAYDIRNAVAHAMFEVPKPPQREDWRFGTLRATDGTISEWSVAHDEFNDVVRDLLGFRVGMYNAANAASAGVSDSFTFKAHLQGSEGSPVECEWNGVGVRVSKRAGRPLW